MAQTQDRVFTRLRSAIFPDKAVVVIIATILLASPNSAEAFSGYNTTWNGVYPGSNSGNNAGCALCHAGQFGGQPWNAYGSSIQQQGSGIPLATRIAAVQSLNADGDPASDNNLTEINNNTQPGWTVGPNNSTFDSSGTLVGSNVSAPVSISGLLDRNVLPTANAGPDQVVNEGDGVNLTGAASSDSDGTVTGYSWTQTDATGIVVTLTGPTTATPSFTAPAVTTNTTLTFSLVVTDNNGGNSVADTVDITVNNVNVIPTANAGPDQVVDEGDGVNLDGTASTDSDGTIAAFAWTQTDATGVMASLTGANTATPSFTAPGVITNTTLTFSLTVTDNDGGNSVADTVDITINNVNVLPTANAGPDQVVDEGDGVNLTGAASSDPDGSVTGYSWTQTDATGVMASLTGANTATPSFTAPGVITDTTLTFSLTVTDNDGGNSVADTVDITINNVNVLPTANAGPDQVVDEGDGVNLTGAASSDPDGSVTGYSWTQTDATGVTASLTGANTATPSFTAPSVTTDTTLTFSLTVTDNDGGNSVADTVDITINNVNVLPTADAGPDQVVDEGDAVNLDGTASADSDGTIAAFAWTQTDTTGVIASLTGASTATPSFTAPAVTANTTLTFELVVTDNDGSNSVADAVDITVNNVNVLPTADAGPDQVVDEGDAVNLDGTASADSDGTIAAFAWTQTDTTGVIASLTGASTATPSFTAPAVTANTTLTFELVVTDNDGSNSVADAVDITVNNVNVLPTANAGPDQIVNEGDGVNLTGAASSDPDGSVTGYSWTQTDATGITATLTGATTATPSFTAPAVTTDTTLTFSLVVTDNDGGNSVADTVDITINNVNVIPTANAGPDQVVDEGDAVNLDGTASADSDGSIAAFAWTQTDATGVTATLTGATTATPSFTAPAVTANTTLTFELVVTDNDGSSSIADAVDITVNNVNLLPTANAGADQIVNEGDGVNLDGTASADSDGSIAAYAWTQTDATGVTATLTGATTATPSFTAPAVTTDTTLTFSLVVTDNDGGNSVADTVDITVNNVNVIPIANAGPDQVVNEGDGVNLTGAASSDPDGSVTGYSWTQTDATGITATLTGATTATPSFTAPAVTTDTTLTFSLTVTDNNGGNSVADTVDITVNNVNVIPVANAGPDQVVNEGDGVNLTGAASSDPDGSVTGYSWTQTDATGINATLTGATTATPSFTAPAVTANTTLTFELVVTDNDGSSSVADAVDITVNNVNLLPTANAGADQIVNEGDGVNLTGAASSDPDGSVTGYSWTQTDATGVTASLTGANTATPSFTAPAVTTDTTLTFSLVVTDNDGSNSVADTVDITVNNVNVLPTANAGPDQIVNEGDAVNLTGAASSDSDGSVTGYSWTQTDTTGVMASLSGASTATPSFTAPAVATDTTLTFELIVTDNNGGNSVADSVNVTVNNINGLPTADAGPDQVVDEGDAVNLDGTASADSDGTIAAFAWTQTDTTGVIASLTGASTATPSFTAPAVTANTTLTFELVVTDNDGSNSVADAVDITVNNVNVLPTANAGPDQIVNEGDGVNLTGAASSDPDGSVTGYSWTQTDATGITATLTGATTATPSFTAPSVTTDTTLTFSLVVTDNDGGNSVADTVDITVNNVNVIPTANAGPDQVVDEGDAVNLDGTASADSDGSIAAFAWTQTDTTGVIASLTGASTATPSFTAPAVTANTTLTFELVVTDNDGSSSIADTVDITVNNVNLLPTANAGADQIVNEGDGVNLDGTASADSDGSIAAYAWTQTDATGVTATLTGATTATPSFTAPAVTTDTTLTFSLVVTDNDGGNSVADTVDITVNNVNVIPIANAGPDQVVNEGDGVNLTGAASSDPDGSVTGYSWTQTDATGVIASLTGASTATPSFTAPAVTANTTLTFELVVTDNDGSNSVADAVDITINNVNVIPTADAGPDQVVDEGDAVNLDGTASADSDGTIAAFAWTQTDTTGVIASLTGASTATPSFTAPAVTANTTLTFELVVTDNDGGNSVADTVDITINNLNVIPTANAGPDQVVDEGDAVNLDGTASADSDGSIAAYAWTQTDATGVTATLTGATTATPSFTAPAVTTDTTLTFSLVVTDNDGGNSVADTVDITVNNVNVIPIANAGPDQVVNEGDGVNLDGTASADSDGTIAAFAWTQTDATGVTASLTGANTATPSFTAPAVTTDTTLTFSLVVTDNDGGNSVADTVDITINNLNVIPTANAGPDQVVDEGDAVNLDGTASADSDGSIAAFAWTQTDATGVTASLTGATTATPSFTAPAVTTDTTLTFSLVVTDNDGGNSVADTVDITVNNVNVIPIANAGPDQVVNEGDGVNLTGAASSDPDGSVTGYSWTQTDATGITATLTGATTATPSFTAPAVTANTTLTFELVVTDNDGSSSVADAVDITVNNVNLLPTANAGADQIVNEGDVVNLDGTASADSDGSIAAFAWTQTDTTGVIASLTGASTATPSFTAPAVTANTTLTFELVVTDNDGSNSVADAVDITVNNVNVLPTANAGPDQIVNEGDGVNLTGAASSDPDGSVTGYSWTQTDATGITATLTGATTATPSFTAPAVTTDTTLTFSLVVTDNDGGNSVADTVDITINNVNVIPTANAGPDQVVDEGDAVNLDGTASADSDGSIAAFAWTQTDATGVTASLTGANTATPSFTAPAVTTDTTLTFSLVVTDNDGSNSVADTVDITVNNVNVLPTANAGPDQIVNEGDAVNLTGAASSDSDGSVTGYSWTQTDTTGVMASLSGASTATPSFTAPAVATDTTLTFELIVTDNNGGNSVADSVNVTVNNINGLPTANAGPDQVVDEGDAVNLDGTASADSDGSIAAYAWTQTDTTGVIASLTGASTATPSFTAPAVTANTTLTFELVVTDNDGSNSVADAVDITVNNVNVLPTANAGPDQIVNEGDGVNLTGAASSDPDGSVTGYSWTQTDATGITATLTGATTATPSFTAPAVTTDTTLTFSLVVTDNDGGNSVADTVDITINNVNVIPTANAGPDQVVDEGDAVNLDGTASADSDGSIAAFAWTQTDATGVTASLTGANTATPSFTAPAVTTDTTLTFSLVVTDNDGGNSVADTVDITINNVNVIPTANAGADQIVNEGDAVNLDGTASADSDGTIAAFAWTQTDATGVVAVLTGATTATPSFTAPAVTTNTILTFSLTVTDNDGGNSVADTVDITVNNVNVIPTASAGPDQVVNEGDAVNLDGTASSDSDGTIAAFAWTQTDTTGVIASLTGASTATPSFTAPAVTANTTLTFELVVTDNDGSNSVADAVDITVNNVNVLPTANAGPDQVVNEGDGVNLTGAASSDPDGSVTSYSWTQTDATGINATLTGTNTATPSFTAPAVTANTTLTFELVVTDNDGGNSVADTVDITVNNVNVIPIANAGPDQVVDEGDSVNLDGTASTDSDGTIADFAWTQTDATGVVAVLTGATTATPSFTAPAVTTNTILTFSLVVTDDDGGNSLADTVEITINNVGLPPTADAGTDQTVDESVIVNLNGTASFDIDGTITDFNWTQTAGTSVTISDANTAAPSFTAPSVLGDTLLQFALLITDSDGATDTASVSVTVNDVLAVDAGVDQQINSGDVVQLNGLNSQSIGGSIDSYQWTQTEGPPVVLDNSSSATPTFVAPAIGLRTAYILIVPNSSLVVFELTVTDSDGRQDFDTTFVNVRDASITAKVSPLDVELIDKEVAGGNLYQFNTTLNPFGLDSVQWTQLAGPVVTLDDSNIAVPEFTAPVVSVDSATSFEVRSTNDDGVVVRAGVNVNLLDPTSANMAPDADAGIDRVVNEGVTVSLNATGSTDSDGSIMSYFWQQTGGPRVQLSSIIAAQPSFVAPAIAAVDSGIALTFEVVVVDDGGFMDRQSVTITVLDNGITAFADDVTAIVSNSGAPIGIQALSGAGLIALEAVDPNSILDNVNRPTDLPYGLIDLSLQVEPGDTVQVNIVLPSPAAADFTWWKYVNGSGWVDYSANTTFNLARDVVTITLTDNGTGDDDPTPGVIRDPGGLGPVSAMAPVVTSTASSDSGGGGGSMGPLVLALLLLNICAVANARVSKRQSGQNGDSIPNS